MNIHATCIRVGAAGKAFGAPASAGILLLGRSGAGKSDLALRLIARGAQLVSDDRTDLSIVRGRLVAGAPKTIAGLMEVRGLGIVTLPCAGRVTVALAVELMRKVPRMPQDEDYRPANLSLAAYPPLIRVNPFEASACDKILVAAMAHARQKLLR